MPGTAQHGMQRITQRAFEWVAIQPAVALHVSDGRRQQVKVLEMTSNQAEMGLKWGDATSQAARNIEQRDFTSAAELRALGISAAC